MGDSVDRNTPLPKSVPRIVNVAIGAAATLLRSGGILLAIVGFTIFAALTQDRFLELANVRNILTVATPIVLLAIGQAFVLFNGEIDLSVGSTVSLASVVLGSYMAMNDALILPVVGLALAVGATVGLLNGWFVGFLGVPSFIVTLGMLLAVQGATLVWTEGGPVSNVAPNFNLLSLGGIGGVPTATIAWLLLVPAAAWIIAHRTRLGRYFFLVGSNARAAAIAGFPVVRTKLVAFVFSGAFAAAAGVYLTSLVGSARGNVGQGMELEAIAAATLGGVSLFGGRGSVLGAAGGGLLLSMLFNYLILAGAPPQTQEIAKGVVIILAVLVYIKWVTKGG